MSELLPDTVRRDQLEIALAAACEPLAMLFLICPDISDRGPAAQAARLAILATLAARCRKLGIGVELQEAGTHQREGRTRGHLFRPVNLAGPDPEAGDVIERLLIKQAPVDPGVPVDPYPRPLTLISATSLDSASLRDLVELLGECIARIEHAAGGAN